MKIIVFGPPGSGKGTLSKKIAQDFQIEQISTGDLFREIIMGDSELSKTVKELIANGNLIPDEITNDLVKTKLQEKNGKEGFILDGYPRTLSQAQALETFSKIDKVIFIEVGDETIVDRVCSRRICSNCGEIYNIKENNISKCSKCGHKLIQRDDDKPEVIKNRLEVYKKETTPLINFYSDRLFKVSNESSFDEMYRSVKTFLEREVKSE